MHEIEQLPGYRPASEPKRTYVGGEFENSASGSITETLPKELLEVPGLLPRAESPRFEPANRTLLERGKAVRTYPRALFGPLVVW